LCKFLIRLEPTIPSSSQRYARLPAFRAIVRAWFSTFGTEAIDGAGQAADAAFKIRDAIKAATNAYAGLGCVHLFMAVPAGLAFMIGQLLNALVKMQTYDLEASEAGSRYRPAALLKPSD
jgi:CBASS immunity sensor of nucleotide second messenger signals